MVQQLRELLAVELPLGVDARPGVSRSGWLSVSVSLAGSLCCAGGEAVAVAGGGSAFGGGAGSTASRLGSTDGFSFGPVDARAIGEVDFSEEHPTTKNAASVAAVHGGAHSSSKL